MSEVKTILVVDDESVLQTIVSFNIEVFGHKALQAGSGIEAMEVLKDNKVDMIISDMKMPDGDGMFILEELKKMKEKAPAVLFVTGFTRVPKEEAIAKGAIDVLDKPVDFKKVKEIIDSL